MIAFAKSILNYFATFNETRFRFSKKVAYTWTSDIFTFDLSVFPNFEAVLLDAVAVNRRLSINVREGEHAVTLDGSSFKTEMASALNGAYGADYLKSCLEKARDQLQTTQAAKLLPVDEEAQVQSPASSPEFETRVYLDGTRQYCLSLRREVGRLLTKLQEEGRGHSCDDLQIGAADRGASGGSAGNLEEGEFVGDQCVGSLNPAGRGDDLDLQAIFLKMPASLAAHGGTMDPEIDVIATRILRNGRTSAAWLGKTPQARSNKAKSNRSRIIATSVHCS
jgi:hypothetical protein